jgi:uncharacterized caspase-like protein/WD40 repeat protein
LPDLTAPEVFLKLDTGTHTSDVVQLVVTPDGRQLISAGECTIRVWDGSTRRLLRVLLSHVSGRSEEVYGPGNVLRMALCPAGGRALVVLKSWGPAAGSRAAPRAATEVQVFDIQTGNLQTRFLHEGEPVDLDFSADGRFIALAGRRAQVQVYVARDLLKAGFDCVPAPLAEHRFGRPARSAGPAAAVRFVAAPRRKADPYALVVAVNAAPAGQGMLYWARFDPATGLRIARRARTEARIAPDTLAVNDEWAVVGARDTVVRGGQKVGRVLCHLHEGTQRDCLFVEAPPAATAFAPTGLRLLVGLSAPLLSVPGQAVLPVQSFAVSCLGFELRSTYHGHDDGVRGLAFLADDLAVSSGGDSQAIHFWDCTSQVGQLQAAIRGVGRTVFQAHVDRNQQLQFGTVTDRMMPARRLGRLRTFCLRSFRLGSTDLHRVREPGGPGATERGWVVLDVTGRSQLVPIRCGATAYGADLALPPDLTLFVGSDDEWVIWTRSGYYDASPLGARRMGYQVNRGVRQEAQFLPSDRFKDFHRPDIVRAVVAHGTEARARAAGVVIPPLDVASLLPPVIELQAAKPVPAKHEARLRFSIAPLVPGGTVTRAWILRNGRFAWTTPLPGPLRQRRFDVPVWLGPGCNVVSVRAENASGRALAVDLEFQGPKPAPPGPLADQASGNLYLLSVGVSRFMAEGTPMALRYDLKPLKCAHRDAIAVYNALACSADSAVVDPGRPLHNRAFDAVEARLLVNEQATKAAIREALLSLCQRIQARGQAPGAERDVLVLFLAGHGVQVIGDPELYFMNHDADLNREDTGLTLMEVGEMLATVPAEVVVLLDTCHSEMAGNGIDRGVGPDEVARRLQEVSERGMYVLSAARADETAYEGGVQGHGVFTAALLATLKSRRYLRPDPDGKTWSLSMNSLMTGLQDEVPRITNRLGKPAQTPVCRVFGDVLKLTIYRR